jgi:hypothetical protein
MFCTSCNKAFSWKTGEIVTSVNRIHNPHYYEWLFRTRGREPTADPARDRPQCQTGLEWEVFTAINERNYHEETAAALYDIHRKARHVLNVERFFGAGTIRQTRHDLFILRLMFLVNNISQEDWRIEIQRKEKKMEKLTAVGLVHDMFVTVAGDIFLSLLHGELTNQKEQLEELIRYSDDCLKKIAKRFSMNVKLISEF